MQHYLLMIYIFCEIEYMQGFALILLRWFNNRDENRWKVKFDKHSAVKPDEAPHIQYNKGTSIYVTSFLIARIDALFIESDKCKP